MRPANLLLRQGSLTMRPTRQTKEIPMKQKNPDTRHLIQRADLECATRVVKITRSAGLTQSSCSLLSLSSVIERVMDLHGLSVDGAVEWLLEQRWPVEPDLVGMVMLRYGFTREKAIREIEAFGG
jgi:hypothetical protein